MKKILLATIILMGCKATAQENFVQIPASSSVSQTVNKLTTIIKSKGLKVFDVIDHQQGAKAAGMELRPTTLVIFGNPAMGTKLMQCDQSIGIDLPMKFLVWQSADNKVWIGYYTPATLAKSYNLEACSELLTKMEGALHNFATAASR